MLLSPSLIYILQNIIHSFQSCTYKIYYCTLYISPCSEYNNVSIILLVSNFTIYWYQITANSCHQVSTMFIPCKDLKRASSKVFPLHYNMGSFKKASSNQGQQHLWPQMSIDNGDHWPSGGLLACVPCYWQ